MRSSFLWSLVAWLVVGGAVVWCCVEGSEEVDLTGTSLSNAAADESPKKIVSIADDLTRNLHRDRCMLCNTEGPK